MNSSANQISPFSLRQISAAKGDKRIIGVAEFCTAWFPTTSWKSRHRPAASGGICRQRTGLRKVQSWAIRRPAGPAAFAI